MKRKNRKIIGAAALIAALAAGGVAFTESQTLSTDTAGYGHISVTGGFDTSDIANTLNALGTDVTSVQVTFDSAIPTGDKVEAGFDDESQLDSCGTGDGSTTVFTCAIGHGSGAAGSEPTDESGQGFAVAVYH